MINIIEELEKQGLILNSRNIGSAKPIIIKESIPFMNGSFDFSKISGNYNYDDRIIDLQYTVMDEKLAYVNNIYNYLQTLFLENSTVRVKFEDIRGFWIGEVTNFSDFEEINYLGKFNIKINAKPFRYSDDMFGDDIWDSFNFEFDVTEIKNYKVENSLSFKLTNVGVSISPIINVDSGMEININNKKFYLKKGVNKIRRLRLKNGTNQIYVTGNGSIEFIYRKELL